MDSHVTAGLDTDGDCKCPANQVLVETDFYGNKKPYKYCRACPTNTAVILSDTYIAGRFYKASKYLCQSCPDPLMIMSAAGTCTCPNGYTLVGVAAIGEQSCLSSTAAQTQIGAVSSASVVKYYDKMSTQVQSLTIQHYYATAAYRCQHYGRPEDSVQCQILANLCALQLYNDQSVPCQTFQNIILARGNNIVNGVSNWGLGMPWLYLSGGGLSCFSTIYSALMFFNNYQMAYLVGTFTMNGTFLGYSRIETLFGYCGAMVPNSGFGGGTSMDTTWVYFGSSKKLTFSCELNTLLTKQQLFYEIYLWDRKPEPERMIPLPVRIKQLRVTPLIATAATPQQQPNSKTPAFLCNSNDVLVRRFFLHDVVSGIGSASPSGNTFATPQIIRYASSITLEVGLQDASSRYIYPPIITINYDTSQPAQWSLHQNVTYTFESRYSMNMNGFNTTLKGFFIAAIVFMGLLWLLRYFNWNGRHIRTVTAGAVSPEVSPLNPKVLIQFVVLVMHSWVMMFFPFTLLIAWYFFVFFKIQKTPSLMLPPMDRIYFSTSPYFAFTVMLHVLSFFQLVYVLMLIYKQCNADIAFIDWEPAKARGDGSSKVSVWRTILAANEWTEMQTMRKTDIRFTLIWMLFFLYGLNLQYNATQQPDLNNRQQGQLNVILRFANTTFWWFVLSYTQYIWKYLIYERYITEPPQQKFIDFCTLAKVSVLVLYEKYHGFYLHCRSPHQYADGTMTELVAMLHKEEAGLTVDRSLEGAPPDVQSFQIFMSGEWRAAFDKIYSVLVRPPTVGEVIRGGRSSQRGSGGRGNAGSGSGMTSLPPEPSLKAWKELSVFLQEFADNNFGRAGLRRVVRERTYTEVLFCTPPDLSGQDQPSVFFPDRDFEYTKALFLGIELDLLLLNILSYSLFDFWFGVTAVSCLLTFLLDWLLCIIRSHWGTALLAKKTLVDERFLI